MGESWKMAGMSPAVCRQWALGRGYEYYGVMVRAPHFVFITCSGFCHLLC
mgnify:CR=1 FL=1